MDYRTWCLLLAAVACTLVTAESASLKDATQLKDPRLDDVLNDISQNAEKEVRKVVSKTRHEKCEILEDGSTKCTYVETSSSSTLSWTPGAIGGLVVGLLVVLACVIGCCICCCRGACGRSRAQPTAGVVYQTPHQVVAGTATPSFPQGAYPKQQF